MLLLLQLCENSKMPRAAAASTLGIAPAVLVMPIERWHTWVTLLHEHVT
jgi:hypothetical protein